MESLKFKVQSSKFLVCIITLLSLFSYSDCMAGDISFGTQLSINHTDKRVSNTSAIIDDDGRIYIGWVKEEGNKNNFYFSLFFSPSYIYPPVIINDSRCI